MNQKMKLNQFLQACFQGDLKAVKSGVKGSREIVNMSDERGISSLHAACSLKTACSLEKKLETAKYLISVGSDKNKGNNNGETALFIACHLGVYGNLEIVKLLLQEGADKDKGDKNGATPLYIASQNGHLEIVRLLLQKGADKDKESNDGTTALFVAAQEGHLEIVRLLISEGADKDKARNDGATPSHIASLTGHLDVVRLLLQNGAFTREQGHLDVMRLLLREEKEALYLLEEEVYLMSTSCPVRRRRGRSCSCCEVQEADGVGTVGGPPKFQLCSACKGVAYCSTTCQSLDWKARHKRECKVLQRPKGSA